MTPEVVMRPIWPAFCSVNQRAPSGPVVMAPGYACVVGIRNSEIDPLVVIRPIWFPSNSVNQRAPSGPLVIAQGSE
jgi:hypothetical protein